MDSNEQITTTTIATKINEFNLFKQSKHKDESCQQQQNNEKLKSNPLEWQAMLWNDDEHHQCEPIINQWNNHNQPQINNGDVNHLSAARRYVNDTQKHTHTQTLFTLAVSRPEIFDVIQLFAHHSFDESIVRNQSFI